MHKDDPFDLANLRLTPEMAAGMAKAATTKQAKAQRPRNREFVMVPFTWIERLKGTKNAAMLFVVAHVLYQHWKTSGKPVPVSNVALGPAGVTRWAKWRTLRELEARGLIRIEARPSRSPLIHIL